MIIKAGVSETHRAQAAHLYWGAFGDKLGRVMGPRDKALAFITRVLDGSHGISAISDDGALLGVVGFKTAKGALVGGALVFAAGVLIGSS